MAQQLRSRPVLERAARLEGLDQQESIDAAVNQLNRGLAVSFSSSAIKGAMTPDQREQLDSYDVDLHREHRRRRAADPQSRRSGLR